MTQFLRSWFHSLSQRSQRSRGTEDPDLSREKRDTVELNLNSTSTNETAFEDYERLYLKNRTLNYIRQIYFYSKFREESLNNTTSQDSGTNSTHVAPPTAMPQTNTTTDGSRTDAVYEQLLEEVTVKATLSELIEGLKDIKEAAERGLMDSAISSLCCPLG